MNYQLNMAGGHDALGGAGVPPANARAELITPTTLTFAAVELMLCVRAMPHKVFAQ